MSDFSFPLDDSGQVPIDATFRVLFIALCYGDLVPERMGEIFAKRGDIITMYEQVRPYPDRVQLVIDRGYIEYVPPPQEYKPREKAPRTKIEPLQVIESPDKAKEENE